MKYILLSLVLFLSVANATVYRSVDNQGNVIFSDTPTEGAEEIILPELPIYSPAVKTNTLTERDDVPKKIDYKVSIASPASNQTFWDNSGEVMIMATLSPSLDINQNHHLRFSVDGKVVFESQSALSYTMKGLERGSHIIVVSVVDGQGTVLKRSKSLLFHLKKHSTNSPANLKKQSEQLKKKTP